VLSNADAWRELFGALLACERSLDERMNTAMLLLRTADEYHVSGDPLLRLR
jgi:hypothetical protein